MPLNVLTVFIWSAFEFSGFGCETKLKVKVKLYYFLLLVLCPSDTPQLIPPHWGCAELELVFVRERQKRELEKSSFLAHISKFGRNAKKQLCLAAWTQRRFTCVLGFMFPSDCKLEKRIVAQGFYLSKCTWTGSQEASSSSCLLQVSFAGDTNVLHISHRMINSVKCLFLTLCTNIFFCVMATPLHNPFTRINVSKVSAEPQMS